MGRYRWDATVHKVKGFSARSCVMVVVLCQLVVRAVIIACLKGCDILYVAVHSSTRSVCKMFRPLSDGSKRIPSCYIPAVGPPFDGGGNATKTRKTNRAVKDPNNITDRCRELLHTVEPYYEYTRTVGDVPVCIWLTPVRSTMRVRWPLIVCTSYSTSPINDQE